MATLILSAIGTLVGGPLGGALGALAGRQVDSLILPRGSREGPRLAELALTTSSYGTPIPRQFGRMRVAGTVIWATDLVESSERQGSGKGRPSTTSYSYSASFAVALSSRPIQQIGRIWADGKLLRGAAGDLKVGGNLRLHTGQSDQPSDPLIASAEGAALCPAWRGQAYAVFEDLQLAEFGNRLPALTFEVLADSDGLSLSDLTDGVDAEAGDTALSGIEGLTADGPFADLLGTLDVVIPMDCDAAGDRLTIAADQTAGPVRALGPAAIPGSDDGFGQATGAVLRRSQAGERPVGVLRYYDSGRDYQPGAQRGVLRDPLGQARVLELPASLSADAARGLVETAIRRAEWGRQILSWRSASLDPAIGPGSIVSVPGRAGYWKVAEWEWRASGVELTLERQARCSVAVSAGETGRAGLADDSLAVPTLLQAFELPWDGTAAADSARFFVAVSASAASWTGAALYHEAPGGALEPLGPSGRTRAILGSAETALAAASPHLLDRTSTLVVNLAADDFNLAPATFEALAQGANRALIGGEIIQFGAATPLSQSRWQLSQLLRGRGGTEAAIGTHSAGEAFVLLDGNAAVFDAAAVGIHPTSRIAAIGLADPAPVFSGLAFAGASLRPLTPVHGKRAAQANGDVAFSWIRRARGAWLWRDEVDTPLVEQREAYLVTFGTATGEVARWDLSEPGLVIPAATFGALIAAAPNGQFRIAQLGSFGLSAPLIISP